MISSFAGEWFPHYLYDQWTLFRSTLSNIWKPALRPAEFTSIIQDIRDAADLSSQRSQTDQTSKTGQTGQTSESY